MAVGGILVLAGLVAVIIDWLSSAGPVSRGRWAPTLRSRAFHAALLSELTGRFSSLVRHQGRVSGGRASRLGVAPSVSGLTAAA